MGPSGHLYSYWIILDCLGQVCIWVELPIQRRLCPIFVNSVGLPDIHEYSAGGRVVNGPPGLGASHNSSSKDQKSKRLTC